MRLVILAVSSKKISNDQRGWCVVGKNVEEPNEWVRLVGDASGRALTNSEIEINVNGCKRPLKKLDVIDADFSESPLWFQPENAIIKSMVYIDSYSKDCLASFVDKDVPLLNDNQNSWTKYDIEKNADGKSVMLVCVQNLNVTYEERNGDSPRTRACFNYKGVRYENFSVTDPLVRCSFTVDSATLCLSLGTPYNPKDENGNLKWKHFRHYKIVAAVYC